MNTITIHAPSCDEAEARVRGILADVLLLGHRHPDLGRRSHHELDFASRGEGVKPETPCPVCEPYAAVLETTR